MITPSICGGAWRARLISQVVPLHACVPNQAMTHMPRDVLPVVTGKPKLKPYTGKTRYKTNADGLVYLHDETWDISSSDAFLSVSEGN
jgi:hypothetical protein